MKKQNRNILIIELEISKTTQMTKKYVHSLTSTYGKAAIRVSLKRSQMKDADRFIIKICHSFNDNPLVVEWSFIT